LKLVKLDVFRFHLSQLGLLYGLEFMRFGSSDYGPLEYSSIMSSLVFYSALIKSNVLVSWNNGICILCFVVYHGYFRRVSTGRRRISL